MLGHFLAHTGDSCNYCIYVTLMCAREKRKKKLRIQATTLPLQLPVLADKNRFFRTVSLPQRCTSSELSATISKVHLRKCRLTGWCFLNIRVMRTCVKPIKLQLRGWLTLESRRDLLPVFGPPRPDGRLFKRLLALWAFVRPFCPTNTTKLLPDTSNSYRSPYRISISAFTLALLCRMT